MLHESSQVVIEQPESLERPAFAKLQRWFIVLALAAALGFLWPVRASEMPGHLAERGSLILMLTLLVAAGAISGYVLRSRMTLPLVPAAIYLGGFLSWLVAEWRSPDWEVFLPASAVALGTLIMTVGVAALIASQLVGVRSRPLRRGSGGIRTAAAASAFLALISAAVSFGLPFGVFGAIFGIGAVLAGISVLEERNANRVERVLVIGGIVFGSLIVLWDLVEFGLLVYRFF